MNVNPGGKQAQMQDGWYHTADGFTVVQQMVFSQDHPVHPGEPKGIKAVMLEHGCWNGQICRKCSSCCNSDVMEYCNKQILERQPDFQEQRSLIQETIEEMGHLCIFLPKFHCELNFIEFFWGRVKKYIHDNCDNSFETLKASLPLALQSVQLCTIRLWEHRSYHWMEAYQLGLGTKDAQLQVQKFSSMKYKSHCWVPESVAQHFD